MSGLQAPRRGHSDAGGARTAAYVAGPRTGLHADYRDGTAIKEGETIAFLKEVLRRVEKELGKVARTFRADSGADAGFWSRAVGDFLLGVGLPFIFALQLQPGLKLLIRNTAFVALEGDDVVEVAEIEASKLHLDARLRIIAIRRRVEDPKAPPQGKVIDGEPGRRFQVLIPSLGVEPGEAWRFYNGRADCERVFKLAKHALGMSKLVGHDLRPNHVAFLLRLLAYNVDILLQRHAECLASKAGRPVIRLGLIARQRRFYNTAGRLLRAANQWLMRVADNVRVERLFAFYAPDLAPAVT